MRSTFELTKFVAIEVFALLSPCAFCILYSAFIPPSSIAFLKPLNAASSDGCSTIWVTPMVYVFSFDSPLFACPPDDEGVDVLEPQAN